MVRRRNWGSFPRVQAQLIQIRFHRPRAHLFLINRAHSYVLSANTTWHPTAATASPEKLPQKARLPLSADGRGIFPQSIPSRLRNWAPSPLWSRGSKAGPPKGLDSRPRTNRVRDNYGRARTWPRPEQAIAWDALSRVRDRQGSLRMGSHRRETLSPRGQLNGPGTH